MMTTQLSRRSLLAAAAAAVPSIGLAAGKKIPVGLELFSVRNELGKDLQGTVKAVAKMGYQGVEFFSPYYSWSIDQTKEMRKLLDDLGIKCFSTHNGRNAFAPENLAKTVEMNTILGSRFVVMASAGRVEGGADGWKKVGESLENSVAKLKPAGMLPGFHNHQLEFKPLEGGGKRPLEIIAESSSKDVVLQLDVGTCVEVGYNPMEWIKQHAGRIKSIHCKEWSKQKGYKAIFNEGDAPWLDIFKTAEKVGGVEFYLIEQEGSDYTPFETAQKCLDNYKALRSGKGKKKTT
jgi:sugar phosphate isomerase/epimerase